MGMKITVKGLRDVDRALSELPKATAKRTLLKVGTEALEPMRAEAQSLAPRDTGDLQISVAISQHRTRRVKRSRGPKRGVELAMGPSAGTGVLNYATHVEFGTTRTAPQPYMRPAFNSNAEEVITTIGDKLFEEVTKATARYARRQAKRAG